MRFLGLTAALLPVYLLAMPLGAAARHRVARTWHRGCCAICSLHVTVEGAPPAGGPRLFAVNHVSYLDIPVLGARLNATFVAKEDVSRWPLFGFLAKLVGTLFVRRERGQAAAQAQAMGDHLAGGGSLILFPEGTSSDGHQVLPFRSALFGAIPTGNKPAAGAADLKVVPVSICYPRYVDGRRLEGGLENFYTWYGDMTLFPHLFTVMGLRGAKVRVIFHDAVDPAAFADRKALAAHCHAQVAQGVARSRVFNI